MKASTRKTTGSEANTARVSIGTAQRIAHLSECEGLPPALISGAFVEIGINMMTDPRDAERLGVDYTSNLRNVIRWQLRCSSTVPVVVTEWAGRVSEQWIKDLNRPREVWMGQMIEIASKHSSSWEAVEIAIPNAQTALFQTMAQSIREDSSSPEVAELLRPSPKVPHAFLAFEHILATNGKKEGGAP